MSGQSSSAHSTEDAETVLKSIQHQSDCGIRGLLTILPWNSTFEEESVVNMKIGFMSFF